MQHEEKLIPVVIQNILSETTIPVYGNGKNVRDWLYVRDHCNAILALLQKGHINATYNIGGNNEIKNIELVHILCEKIALPKGLSKEHYTTPLITFVKDRKGHDFRYAINCDKIRRDISWYPQTSFERGIEETINWYITKWDTQK